MRQVFLGSMIALTAICILSSGASAQSEPWVIECSELSGSGSYSDPYILGNLDGVVAVRNCAPLSSGRGFNTRYFLFSISHPLGAVSEVGTWYSASGPSGVHPRLAASNGFTLATSLSNGYWWSDDPRFEGRWLNITGLQPGTYRFGAEKLSSPLMSTVTAPYDIYFFLQ